MDDQYNYALDSYNDIEMHEIDELWCLSEYFSVADAAALVAGYNPVMVQRCCKDSFFDQVFSRYPVVLAGLCSAISNGRIKTEEEFGNDLSRLTVSRDSLVSWLSGRGVRSGFFFQGDDRWQEPDFFDPGNGRYAPKLAAAARAWQAVTDPGKKSPKQALEKWIREHAAEFGLTDDDGNPVNQAIEECAKVANWQQSGGAPKS